MRLPDHKPYNHVIHAGAAAFLVALGATGVAIPGYAQSSSGNMTGNMASSGGAQNDDAALVARVKSALHNNKTMDARHIKVDSQNGDVVLSGFAESQRAVVAAGEIATKAAGTHKVVNNIHLEEVPKGTPGT